MEVVYIHAWPNQSCIIYSALSPETFEFRLFSPFISREILDKLFFKFGNVKNVLDIVLTLKINRTLKQEEGTSSAEKSI